MPVELKLADYQAMIKHAREMAPVEDCGLVGGRIAGDVKIVEKIFYLTNTEHSGEHFRLDPKEQFAAVKELREQGLQLLGNWHSHPASPPRPSEEDKRLAFDAEASYFILSLQGREPVLNSFRVSRDKIVTKEELHIR